MISLEGRRLLAVAVHLNDLLHISRIQGMQLRERAFLIREIHSLAENVCFHQISLAVSEFQRLSDTRNPRLRVYVAGHFIIEAAFELAALPRQFLRIERQILCPRRIGRDGLERRNIIGAAKLAPADSEASDQPRLLARTDLLHLNPDAEFLRKDLDQLTEIHTPVGDIIENRLGTVALELHIPDLHLETQLSRNLTRPDHGLMLPRNGLMPFLYVVQLGFAIDFLEFRGLRVNPLAAHLPRHDRAL